MTRFKEFLSENHKQQLTLEEAAMLCATHCKDALQNNVELWRGSRAYDHKPVAWLLQGDQSTRKSANTSNHYTVILDHVLTPLGYPKRSASIICSIDSSRARGYGRVYRLFPYDGVKIGVCPERDMFWTPIRLPDGKAVDVIDVNHMLSSDRVTDKSYAALVSDLAAGKSTTFGKSKEEINKFFETAYSPEQTGMQLVTTKDFPALNDNECWVGGKMIAVRQELLEDFMGMVHDYV